MTVFWSGIIASEVEIYISDWSDKIEIISNKENIENTDQINKDAVHLGVFTCLCVHMYIHKSLKVTEKALRFSNEAESLFPIEPVMSWIIVYLAKKQWAFF